LPARSSLRRFRECGVRGLHHRLVDGKTLVWVDPATKKVTGKADIKGAANVVGIDVRPADGMLLRGDRRRRHLHGRRQERRRHDEEQDLGRLKGTITVVDFNPAADRLRVITSDGANLRINVDDGKTTVDGTLKYKDGDMQAGKTPKVVAGAYTNSANPKPTATALYDIDDAGHLLSQAPPNDGVLNTVGMLGVKLNGRDRVQHRQQGRGQRGLAGDRRHALLGRPEDGKATSAGKLEGVTGKLSDIAWID
jgi:hypothetical protein